MSKLQETQAINQRCAECCQKKQPFVLTESEWLACGDSRPLLEFLRGKVSDRKITLFATACYRRIWDLADLPCRQVVEAVERFADGGTGEEEIEEAYKAWVAEVDRRRGQIEDGAGGNTFAAIPSIVNRGVDFADAVSDAIVSAFAYAADRKSGGVGDIFDPIVIFNETDVHAALVRELFGNPFRPVILEAGWFRPEIVDLCQAISRERRFDRMPAVGDALSAAGCSDQTILGHCRESGHVLGCWVLDLLMNKQ